MPLPPEIRNPKKLVAHILAPIATSVLLALTTAPYGLHFLTWISLLPLLLALSDAPPRTAVLRGWLCGVVFIFLQFPWMLTLLGHFMHLPWPVAGSLFVLYAALAGIWIGAFGGLVSLLRERGRATPLAMAATYVVTSQQIPSLVPVQLGDGLVALPLLVQVADLGGATLVALIVALTSGALWELFSPPYGVEGRRWPRFIVPALALTFLLGYGALRTSQIQTQMHKASKLLVGLIQGHTALPGMPPEQKMAIYRNSAAALAAEGAQLILWPEAALDQWIEAGSLGQEGSLLPAIGRQIEAIMVVGALSQKSNGPMVEARHSTAWLLGPQGSLLDHYNKVKLIPFGEYVPGLASRPSLVAKYFPAAFPPLDRGQRRGPWVVKGVRLCPLVCLESALPSFTLDRVRETLPHLIVNLVDDRWAVESGQPDLHFQQSALRAVEHRRAVISAADQGISGIVDPLGQILLQAPKAQPCRLSAEVPLMTQPSLYSIVGDWVTPLCLILAIAAHLLPRKRIGPLK